MFLIRTSDGLVLLDGGLPESAPLVASSIATLGFALDDVRYLLNSHAHFDHAGGLAALKAQTGATLVASAGDTPALERGTGPDMPPVVVDRQLADGDQIRLGEVQLTAHVTPGHTPGCTSWSMTTTDAGRTYSVYFHCSTSVVDTLVGNRRYPGIVADYERTFERLRTIDADVFLANHPQFFDLAGKRARLVDGVSNPFVDSGEMRRYLASSERAFRVALDKARGGGAAAMARASGFVPCNISHRTLW
jgi:metallo-beta-lactamase class B